MRNQSGAIKTALKEYNDAAALLNPPREPLMWSTILKAATIADFDLLHNTQMDICRLPWTEPLCREATTYYFGIKHAHEEILWLNIEITCLLTFMYNTHVDYHLAIQCYKTKDPPLATSLTQQWQYEDHINESVVLKLIQTSKLHGFTEFLTIGSRIGCHTALSFDVPLPCWASLIQSTSTLLSGGDWTDYGN